jgi:hypothetical protein
MGAGDAGPQAGAGAPPPPAGGKSDDGVIDADFEMKDDKKK